MGAAHSDDSTDSITPYSTKRCSSNSTLCLKAWGVGLYLQKYGLALSHTCEVAVIPTSFPNFR